MIGILHAIFFYVGDILTVYAIIGFILLLFRKASDKFILRSAIILIFLPVVQYFIFWLPAVLNQPTVIPDTRPAFFDQLILTYKTGGFSEIIQMNIGGLIFGRILI